MVYDVRQDHLMLEQEWNYLASKSPYDSYMETCMPKETNSNSNNSKTTQYFPMSNNCAWKIHLVSLPR